MKRWAIGVAVILALAAGAFWLQRQLEIDRCLDRGDWWEYPTGTCHPSE